MSLQVRQIAEKEIMRFKAKTILPLETLLRFAGIPERTWREWQERQGIETRHNNNIPRNYYLTPEEVRAIVAFCIENPLLGYRMLCWEMVDRNVAFVSCSSVYNIIKRYNLGKKWAEAEEMTSAVLTSQRRFTSSGILIFRISRYKVHFIIFLVSLTGSAGRC